MAPHCLLFTVVRWLSSMMRRRTCAAWKHEDVSCVEGGRGVGSRRAGGSRGREAEGGGDRAPPVPPPLRHTGGSNAGRLLQCCPRSFDSHTLEHIT
eukprot:76622-Chlamydomonas_euryale.AAC.1